MWWMTLDDCQPAQCSGGPRRSSSSGALGYANTPAGDLPPWLWIITAVIYSWLLTNLALLIIPSHRPLHDRPAGTVVVRNELLVSAIA
jgi:hypothetical protein